MFGQSLFSYFPILSTGDLFWRFSALTWQFSEKQNWQYIEFTMNHLPVRTVAAYIGFVITVGC